MSQTDTIYALSSGNVPAGIAVVRISGSSCAHIVSILCGSLPKPRYATLCALHDRESRLIDHALCLWFPAPHSFTGEDCAEFHIHGGRAVLNALFEALSDFDDTRFAERGEFSQRAFLNNKMDLIAAEGLADLIAADTDFQRQQALSHSNGLASDVFSDWRKRLLYARSMIDAEFDFSDEEDIPDSISSVIWTDVETLSGDIQKALDGGRQGERIRDGLIVVLSGKPNAGKSSLLNALAKRDVAIVSDIAGTTRDIIEVQLDLDGYPVRLFDTAGLRSSDDVIEQLGVKKAQSLFKDANLVLHLIASDDLHYNADDIGSDYFTDIECPIWKIETKFDLTDKSSPSKTVLVDHSISVYDESLLNTFISELSDFASKLYNGQDMALITRQRHRDCLNDCLCNINEALNHDLPIEVRAEYLRQASDALGRLVGRIDVEEVLGVIFSQFCVGK